MSLPANSSSVFARYTGNVQRYVTIADYRDGLTTQWRVQILEVRMTVIPADKGRTADHTIQIAARNIQHPVIRRTGRQYHSIINILKLGIC